MKGVEIRKPGFQREETDVAVNLWRSEPASRVVLRELSRVALEAEREARLYATAPRWRLGLRRLLRPHPWSFRR